MKSTKKVLLLTSILVGSILSAGGAIAGVKNTKHNLGSTGTGTNNMDGTGEVCVFCHTPHGSDTTAVVPLWNKTLPSTVYSTYDTLGTSSLDGGIAAVGSVSVACLSCHDGTQAMDVMINQPGSGGYNPAGARLAGTWNLEVGATGLMPAGIANIGADLQNDHPIGIQYAGGGYTNTGGTPSTAADKDFFAPTKTTINATPVWYIETGTAGRDKADLPLYTRNTTDHAGGALAGENEPFVECASCHDPHVEDTAGSNPTFLRIANTGSAVCLACHDK